jgi:carbamoyltransferase
MFVMKKTSQARFQPRHPALGHVAARAAKPLAEWLFKQRHIHRPNGHFAADRLRELAARLARGETAYVAGISIGGFHNSGVALIEVTAERGLCIICNNEEERFSGRKHANHFPIASLEALAAMMNGLRIDPEQIVAWLATYDYPLFVATGARSVFEELPGSLQLVFQSFGPKFDLNQLREGMRAPVRLGQLFGRDKVVPIIGTVHHDTHAWFSYLVSPFARDPQPVMIAVIDSSGDCASISLYVGENGTIRQIRSNGSFFDSLGMFYSVISSTQGGWTPLSSEGRYMGAAAYGDVDRLTNRFYPQLRDIFSLRGEGDVRLNRALAHWPIGMLRKPYAPKLVGILGPPISPSEMWNPDAVLRVEDINHRPDTKDRVDKAAVTQMVFEDALVHIVDWLIQTTGGDRLVLTGGAALNAVANMRLLERFDASYYDQTLKQSARLHLWVPPVPGDAGSPLGAAYAFVARAGVRFGHALNHAFYCGSALRLPDIQCALKETPNMAWTVVGDGSCRSGIDAVADLMAFITANDGIIAIFQGRRGDRAACARSPIHPG